MKLAGRRGAAVSLTALAMLALVGPAMAGAAKGATLVETTVTIPAGSFYREDVFLPSDGSRWQASFIVESGSLVDAYILRTVEALSNYPVGDFPILELVENATSGALSFAPGNRFDAYSLILDNTDNSRASDARPQGEMTVRLVRSAPVRDDPRAVAALSTAANICAVALVASTVGLAVYLKRRPARPAAEREETDAPRVEIPVAVPERPRGAWASSGEVEAEVARAEPPGGEPR